MYNTVLKLGREVYTVSGNMDYLPLPETQVFTVNNIPIGVYHGDGVYPRGDNKGLTKVAIKLGVKLLFTGHTHSYFIKKGLSEDVLLLNPGSLTGVWSGGGGSMKPSMIILEFIDNYFKYELFELNDGRLNRREGKIYFRDNKWFLE
ncbi:MAG: YfcE family phosphodiesterase [Desulfurococcaceae archaeon]